MTIFGEAADRKGGLVQQCVCAICLSRILQLIIDIDFET